MYLFKGTSISFRFTAVLLVVLAVGQGFGAVLFLSSIRHGFMTALHDRMTREIKQAAAILPEPVATINTSLIDLFMTATLKDLDVQSIQVLDALQVVTQRGQETISEVNSLVPVVSSLHEDIEALQLERGVFSTSTGREPAGEEPTATSSA
jgi:hypothetical protein